MDWAETRLRLQLWLHRSWPLRALSWWFERGVPRTQGFGRFRADCFDLRGIRPGAAMTEVEMVERYRIGRFAEMTWEQAGLQDTALNSPQVDHARAFLADAERPANSQLTRIDAAVNAISALDPTVILFDRDIGMYRYLKFARPLTDAELTFYYDTTRGLAKALLSKLENIDDEHG